MAHPAFREHDRGPLTVEDALGSLRDQGFVDPTIVWHASSGDRSVFFFDAFEPGDTRSPTYGYHLFEATRPIEFGRSAGKHPSFFVKIVGAMVGTVDDVVDIEGGFLIGLIGDQRVVGAVLDTERGDRIEEPVAAPAFMVELTEAFHPEFLVEWRLLDSDGTVLYRGTSQDRK